MIIVQKTSRVYRLYLWSMNLLDFFYWREDDPQAPLYTDGTNLCHLMRVLFIFMPFVFVAQIAALSALALVIVILPVNWFGVASWARGVMVILAGAGLLVGLVALKMYLAAIRSNSVVIIVQSTANLVSLVAEWVKAKKERICPLVRFQ